MDNKKEKTKVVPAAKCSGDVQKCLEVLDDFTSLDLRKMIFDYVAPKIDILSVVQLAVRQYLQTKDMYFLDRVIKIVEDVLSNNRYETGIYNEICYYVKELYDGEAITEEQEEWLKKFTATVLCFAVIRNTKIFFDTITGIVKKYNIYIPELYKIQMKIFGSNNKQNQLIEFRRCKPEYEWMVPRCCLSDDDDGDEYEECGCDPAKCKIFGKVIYFTTSICLHKNWLDSTWNAYGGVDLGEEIHKKYCGYIEQAHRMLSVTYCEHSDIDMELLHAQYQLFVNTYVNM